MADALAENASAPAVETKTLPSLDELLPESTEVTGELPPVPDELQPLDAGASLEETPAKRRRAAPRRTKKVVEESTPQADATGSTGVDDAPVVSQVPTVDTEAPEGE
jgi:hypothetical protein